MLLHGTKKDYVDVISNQGLDSRVANSVYFGSGVYCAESSTKADQYAGKASKTAVRCTITVQDWLMAGVEVE